MQAAKCSVQIRVCVDFGASGQTYRRVMCCVRLAGMSMMLTGLTECLAVVALQLENSSSFRF